MRKNLQQQALLETYDQGFKKAEANDFHTQRYWLEQKIALLKELGLSEEVIKAYDQGFEKAEADDFHAQRYWLEGKLAFINTL